MIGNDGFELRVSFCARAFVVGCDRFIKTIWLHRERGFIDIHEHWRCAGPLNRGDSGDCGLSDRQNRVAASNAARAQAEFQRIGSVRDADAVLRA